MRKPIYSQNKILGSCTKAICLMTVVFFCVLPVHAQEDEQKGIEQGNYNIKQSIEFGGRFASIGGDTQTYDTFVNLQQGPRLLGFTTEMNSLNHHGSLFDRLYFSNFGYGGDPNDVSRLRISKNKWYDFDALFRRDENFLNYSLLANPLNPTAPFTNGPPGYGPPACTNCVLSNSPHAYNSRRRMSDYNLTFLPQSRVRFRLGYARNVNDGPAFSTIHQGTEQFLLSDVKDTVNAYRLGVDFKILPRTNISYDQIFTYYKGDTGLSDNNQNFLLANGTPIDLGVSFNATANQPCGGTFLAGGLVNPACSAYISYLRHGRTRTNSPTEQLSMQSNYFRSWDFSARASYTAGDMNVNNWIESLTGREARTNLYNQNNSGPIFGRHVAANADFGATWRITEKLSFIDSFHFANWHNPAEFDDSSCSFFNANMLVAPRDFTSTAAVLPLSIPCTPPSNAVAGTPVHNASSAPDISFAVSSLLLKQDEKTNLSELEYQFSSRLGVRAGFRYRHRAIDDSDFETATNIYFPSNANRGACALAAGALPDGCTAIGGGAFAFVTPGPEADTGETLINEYAGLFGIWARPLNHWRISFDAELMGADNSFTRISPRQTQEYRLRSTYKPVDWFHVGGSITIWEGRNNVAEVNNLQHNRVYAVSAGFQPSEKIGVELGYDYNDVFSQILVCFTSSAVVTGPNSVGCTGVPGLIQQLSTYTNKSNFGYFDASWSPFRRLTARLGANLTGTSGTVLIISPNAPSGPLDSTYYQPFGGIDYRIAKGWTGRAYWGYYGYHEDPDNVFQDIFAPRNFRANLVTLSLRYAF
jgi:hypothetical protein